MKVGNAMPDKTGAMILSTLMMLAVASALSASTPQRNLSSCCSCDERIREAGERMG